MSVSPVRPARAVCSCGVCAHVCMCAEGTGSPARKGQLYPEWEEQTSGARSLTESQEGIGEGTLPGGGLGLRPRQVKGGAEQSTRSQDRHLKGGSYKHREQSMG